MFLELFVLLSIAYTIYRIVRYFFIQILDLLLEFNLNKGSDTYLEFKNKLESCIKSGEINAYFEGFQFIKIDNSNDSEEMSDLQSMTTPLSRIEKRKLMIFGRNLLNNL